MPLIAMYSPCDASSYGPMPPAGVVEEEKRSGCTTVGQRKRKHTVGKLLIRSREGETGGKLK